MPSSSSSSLLLSSLEFSDTQVFKPYWMPSYRDSSSSGSMDVDRIGLFTQSEGISRNSFVSQEFLAHFGPKLRCLIRRNPSISRIIQFPVVQAMLLKCDVCVGRSFSFSSVLLSRLELSDTHFYEPQIRVLLVGRWRMRMGRERWMPSPSCDSSSSRAMDVDRKVNIRLPGKGNSHSLSGRWRMRTGRARWMPSSSRDSSSSGASK